MSFGYFNGSVWGRRRILVAAPLVLEPVDAPKGLAHGDVEELEELVELLLLEIYGALLLQGLLKVELESAFCDGRSGKLLSSDGGQRSERGGRMNAKHQNHKV
jgi:hypothetical protein